MSDQRLRDFQYPNLLSFVETKRAKLNTRKEVPCTWEKTS